MRGATNSRISSMAVGSFQPVMNVVIGTLKKS
jgi:hypothetical protein